MRDRGNPFEMNLKGIRLILTPEEFEELKRAAKAEREEILKRRKRRIDNEQRD